MNGYATPYIIERLLLKRQSTLTPIEKCARRLWLSGDAKKAVEVLAQLENLKGQIGVLSSIVVGHGITLEE